MPCQGTPETAMPAWRGHEVEVAAERKGRRGEDRGSLADAGATDRSRTRRRGPTVKRALSDSSFVM